MQRLQKTIADSGYCSRRKAEELIVKGQVKVNDVIVRELGTKTFQNDKVTIDDKPLAAAGQKEYYLLYKPKAVLSTTKDDKGRQTVLDFFPVAGRIYPVGRLDYNTTGLLLLTSDGEFANLMMHPSSEIFKVYIAKIKGVLTGLEIRKLKTGIRIEKSLVKADKVKVKSYDRKQNVSIIEITIHDGKNHQVKKMLEDVNHEVIKLKRETYGFLTLDNLKPGESRALTPKEIKKLYAMATKDSLKKEE